MAVREAFKQCEAEGLIRIGMGRACYEKAWKPWPICLGSFNIRETTSYVLSGACADAMLMAIINVDQRFRAAVIRGGLIATVHDELLAEVHRDDAEQAQAILEQSMLDAFTAVFPGARSRA